MSAITAPRESTGTTRYVQFLQSGLAYRGRMWESGDVVDADPTLLALCEPSKSGKTWCKEVRGAVVQGAMSLPPVPHGMKVTESGLKAMSRAEMKAEYD